jgi:TolB-like protein/Tfp pilus assembly protein PilF
MDSAKNNRQAIMSFIDELKRRNVFRVGIAYVIVAWLLLQVADVVLPTFRTPEWVMQAFTFLLILGFPLALIFAWAFELTPEGIKLEKDVDGSESVTHLTGRKLDFAIIGLMAMAILYLVLDNYVLDRAPSEAAEEIAQESIAARLEFDKSIAVLPFRNRSALAEDAYFVDGIHDDILTQLAKLSSLKKVISRTTMEQYRETTKPMPQIGQELGVATILEGGVQRAGDRVRINVQLIDAKSDEHLWAETYDRRLTAANIFSIQSEIATAIATALRATLSPEEQRNIANVPTENLEAYEAYQLGRRALARRTNQSITEAIELFAKATAIDSEFAQAWAGLSDGYRLLAHYSGQNVDDLYQKARTAVDRALEVDDQLSEPQTALATLLEIQGDFTGAMLVIERALKLDPNSADAHFRYADLLHETGHVDQSLLEWEVAVQLDPLSPIINDAYAWTLAEVGRFDEALARYRRVDEIDPRYPGTAMSIGTIYGLAYGRLDLANLWYRKALALDPDYSFIAAILGLVFLELDDDDTAVFWINRALQQSPQHPWANGALMMLHSYRGDSEQVSHYADEVLSVDPRWRMGTALSHGRVSDLRDGNYDAVLERYELSFPELFSDDPEVNSVTYRPAIDVAGILLLAGEYERAADLLDKCQKQITETIRIGFHGFWVSDVQILALQGKTDGALTALRQAIDQSWRTDWRYFFYVDPNLDSIRGKPEFQAILRDIKDDMAAQLQLAREMDANGELVAIPPAR